MQNGRQTNSPFFIVGSGRSGTTLLRLLLCQHSRLYIPPETWFITPLVETLPVSQPLTPAEVARAVDIIVGHYRWPDMQIGTDDFRRDAFSLANPKLVDVINLVYGRLLEASGKQRFGDKTPPYIHIMSEILALYPDAKFIHLIRDGRDVQISFVDADFHGPGTRGYHGKDFEWTAAIRAGRRARQSSFAARVFEVRYEDLVTDVAGTMRNICAFLGETFEPQMVNPSPDATVPDREKHIHQKLDRPISSDAAGGWRSKLTPWESFMLEASLSRELRALGYPLRFSAPGWRPFLALGNFATRISAPLIDRAVPFLQRRKLLRQPFYF